MIKKLLLSALGLLLLSTSSCKEEPLADTLLWKIEGNDLEQPSYLFGTVHATCEVVISDKIQTALAETNKMVMEINMNDLASGYDESMGDMLIGNGETWEDHISAEEYNKLKSFLDDYESVNINMVQIMKPNIVGTLLITDLVTCSIESYEMQLLSHANSNNMELIGLETLQEQMDLLVGESLDLQFEKLLKMADIPKEESEALMQEMMDLYNAENLQGLYEYITREHVMNDMINQEDLLDKRNQNWIPKIGEIVKGDSAFIAVGAGHLPGEMGVINLLKQAGYTLTPIMD